MRLILGIDPGETISDVAQQAQTFADSSGNAVEFEFNGVLCIAEPNGTWDHLVKQQVRAQAAKLLVRSRANTIETVYIDRDAA